MKPFFCILAAFVAATSGQRVRSGRQGGSQGGYGAPPPSQPQYGNQQVADSSNNNVHVSDDHQGLDWLLKSVPGQPGTDYPIYAEVPDTSFVCDGQVEGGYYADTEAECQPFHVCTADGFGGLTKYSFLCPNGTIFNQEYFICDWWFNFDCSSATSLYSLNEDIAAEREAATAAGGNGGQQSPSGGSPTYASPVQPSYGSGGGDFRSGRRLNN